MTNVLLVTSSPRGEAAYSTQVATDLAHEINDAHLKVRDLWSDPLPHIGPEYVHAVFTPSVDRTPAQRKALTISDDLISELKGADIIIVAAAMINFGIPSTLKAWIDYVCRSGETFRYSEAGPEGLLTGKKTILVLASGGVYSTGAMTAFNHLEPHLRSVFGFIGLTEIETILVEGVSMGAEAAEKALVGARSKAALLAVSEAA